MEEHVNRKYKQIEEWIECVDIADLLDGSAARVIEEMQQLISDYGDSVFLKSEYYGYDGGIKASAHYMRPETDKEYNTRTLKEAKALERKEKATLKRLEKAAEKRAQKEGEEKAELKRLQGKYDEA